MGAFVDLGEFVVSAGETDLESFDLAEPAFPFGFDDPGDEVVADLYETVALGGVRPEHGAADVPLTEIVWEVLGCSRRQRIVTV